MTTDHYTGDAPRAVATPPPTTAPPTAKRRMGSLPGIGRRRGEPVPVDASPQGLPTRRRWGRIAAGAILALLGGWISVSLYVTAGDRVEVVALARDVAQFEEIEREDLELVRVAADPDVHTLAGSEVDEIVGRRAAMPLLEGGMLTESQLVGEDDLLVEEDEAVIGLELGPNQAARNMLDQGVEVQVVLQPPGNASDPPRQVPGWVLDVGEPDEHSDMRSVEVVVPTTSLADVAVAAANGQVVLVAIGGMGP